MTSTEQHQSLQSQKEMWWDTCHDIAVQLEHLITRDPNDVPASERPNIIAELEKIEAAMKEIDGPFEVYDGHSRLEDAILHLKLCYEHLIQGQDGETEYYYTHALMLVSQLYYVLIQHGLVSSS